MVVNEGIEDFQQIIRETFIPKQLDSLVVIVAPKDMCLRDELHLWIRSQ